MAMMSTAATANPCGGIGARRQPPDFEALMARADAATMPPPGYAVKHIHSERLSQTPDQLLGSGQLSNGTAWAVCGRPLLDIRGAAGLAILGTMLGPHVIRDGERPALLWASPTRPPTTQTISDLGKRLTATFWGSSGRRFKSCQPDLVKWALTCC